MKEIIIPVPNRPGIVAEVSGALAAVGVNIEEMDAGAANESGVIIITVDRYDDALRALNAAGFSAISEDAIVLKLVNEPGALAKVARRLGDAGIGIRSLRIAKHLGKTSLVTLVTDDQEEVRRILGDIIISL